MLIRRAEPALLLATRVCRRLIVTLDCLRLKVVREVERLRVSQDLKLMPTYRKIFFTLVLRMRCYTPSRSTARQRCSDVRPTAESQHQPARESEPTAPRDGKRCQFPPLDGGDNIFNSADCCNAGSTRPAAANSRVGGKQQSKAQMTSSEGCVLGARKGLAVGKCLHRAVRRPISRRAAESAHDPRERYPTLQTLQPLSRLWRLRRRSAWDWPPMLWLPQRGWTLRALHARGVRGFHPRPCWRWDVCPHS